LDECIPSTFLYYTENAGEYFSGEYGGANIWCKPIIHVMF
jgi:hypothetical protein